VFKNNIVVSYLFEREQCIKFEVIDIDPLSTELVGTFETTIAKLMLSDEIGVESELQIPNKKEN
jgi:hypothetical protein